MTNMETTLWEDKEDQLMVAAAKQFVLKNKRKKKKENEDLDEMKFYFIDKVLKSYGFIRSIQEIKVHYESYIEHEQKERLESKKESQPNVMTVGKKRKSTFHEKDHKISHSNKKKKSSDKDNENNYETKNISPQISSSDGTTSNITNGEIHSISANNLVTGSNDCNVIKENGENSSKDMKGQEKITCHCKKKCVCKKAQFIRTDDDERKYSKQGCDLSSPNLPKIIPAQKEEPITEEKQHCLRGRRRKFKNKNCLRVELARFKKELLLEMKRAMLRERKTILTQFEKLLVVHHSKL